ncbi:hypothetical protein U1707_17615 [Sphingomonas sp. PB2P12]|uniref:CHASE3 domain-containing protein n=1 Tax=Sphingomonas sandaracina TaxID=3096157 RepID=UPI002FC82BC5
MIAHVIRARSVIIFAVSFIILLTLVVVVSRLSATNESQQVEAQWWRAHTFDVLVSAEQMDTALNQALRGERGYILTRHSRPFATFKTGLRDYARLSHNIRMHSVSALEVGADGATSRGAWFRR